VPSGHAAQPTPKKLTRRARIADHAPEGDTSETHGHDLRRRFGAPSRPPWRDVLMPLLPTILVVDDEPVVVGTLAEIFEKAGYRVETAPDAPAALGRIADAAPDAVMIDYRLPGMNGEELYEAISRRYPDLSGRCVVVAANPQSDALRAFIGRTGVPLLAKPFDIEHSLQLLQHVLDRGR
jgi:CheY-like chemotaxis protein